MSVVFHIKLTANRTICIDKSWFLLTDLVSNSLEHFSSNHTIDLSNGRTIIVGIFIVTLITGRIDFNLKIKLTKYNWILSTPILAIFPGNYRKTCTFQNVPEFRRFRLVTLVVIWCIFSMYFLPFLDDWNHTWKIHQIFSNTSNNLLENQPFWLEVISRTFLIFGVFFLIWYIVYIHVVYHSTR